MTGRKSLRVRPLALALVGLAAVIFGALLAEAHLERRPSVLDRLEAVSLDLRFLLLGARPAPDDVVVVALDDETIRGTGYPLPRDTIAALVRRLAEARPKAIGLDILFLDPGPLEADAKLAEALRGAPAVIAAAGIFPEGAEAEGQASAAGPLPAPSRIAWPQAKFRDAAAVGFANLTKDELGTPRQVPLLLRAPDGVVPALGLAIAAKSLGTRPAFAEGAVILAGRTVATDEGATLTLRPYGPRGAVRTVSAAAVLAGTVPAETFAGRTLLVGATALATGDTFDTSFGLSVPGVEVQATAVANLLHGHALRRDGTTRAVDAAAAILLPPALVLLMNLRRVAAGLAAASLLALAWILATVLALRAGVWIEIGLPLGAALPAVAAAAGTRLWLDRRRIDQLALVGREFSRFHAPVFAARLENDPYFLAEPLERQASVVFVDLSGFTGFSEAIGPAASREFLKGFHQLVDETVTRHGGAVIDFMGDGAMILFGFPDPEEADPCRALQGARALERDVTAWLGGRTLDQGSSLAVRVGAHHGPVVISRLGGERHQQITATGDTVNVASRLLEIASLQGRSLIVAEALVVAAGPGCDTVHDLGPPRTLPVRGREGTLTVRTAGRGEEVSPPLPPAGSG